MDKIFFFLASISIFSTLLRPLCAIFFIRAFNTQLKALFIYMVIACLSEIMGFLAPYFTQSNEIVYDLFTLFEFIILVYVLLKELKPAKIETWLLAIYLSFISLWCYEFFFTTNTLISYSIEALVIISLSVYYFYKVFMDMEIVKLTKHYFFWINSGFLIYFTATFFVMLFEEFIREGSQEMTHFLWVIQLISNIIFSTLLIIGICKVKRT